MLPLLWEFRVREKKKIETLQKLNPEPRYLEMKLAAAACKTNLGSAAYRAVRSGVWHTNKPWAVTVSLLTLPAMSRLSPGTCEPPFFQYLGCLEPSHAMSSPGSIPGAGAQAAVLDEC